jgi:predicted ATPase
MIGGEPGIGKTRLTQEIALEAGKRRIRTLRGHCYEEEASTPYLPFIEILEAACAETPREEFRGLLGEDAGEIARMAPRLRRMFDDIPPPLELPAEQQQRYLFNAVCDFIARIARVAPLVLVAETSTRQTNRRCC